MQIKSVMIAFVNDEGKEGTLEIPEGDIEQTTVQMDEAGPVQIMSMMTAAKNICRTVKKNMGDEPASDERQDQVQDPR